MSFGYDVRGLLVFFLLLLNIIFFFVIKYIVNYLSKFKIMEILEDEILNVDFFDVENIRLYQFEFLVNISEILRSVILDNDSFDVEDFQDR